MSKMGQELEKRLDENKYEIYEALSFIVDNFNTGEMDGFTKAMNEGIPKAKKVLAKVEGK